MENRCVAPFIPKFDTRMWWTFSCRIPLLLPLGKDLHVCNRQKVKGIPDPEWSVQKTKNLLPLLGITLQFLSFPAHGLVFALYKDNFIRNYAIIRSPILWWNLNVYSYKHILTVISESVSRAWCIDIFRQLISSSASFILCVVSVNFWCSSAKAYKNKTKLAME